MATRIDARWVQRNGASGILKTSPYWPWRLWSERAAAAGVPAGPTSKQAAFLAPWWVREILYGGAVGGGKSEALLMAALQYVDQPGYAALIVRKTFRRLAAPGSLIPRSHEWLRSTDARYNTTDHQWTFPSGATITFGHLEHEGSEHQYGSTEFQFIAFDEVTEIAEEQYRFLAGTRLRRKVGMTGVPLRVRCASNPVGPGKDWVKRRFIAKDKAGNLVPAKPGRRHYMPATIRDNPHIDAPSYIAGLRETLDPITLEQMLAGDWDIVPEGGKFRRRWFVHRIVPSERIPWDRLSFVRFWDLAATEEPKSSEAVDPDFTCGVLMARMHPGQYYVLDVIHGRWSDFEVEQVIARAAREDTEAYGFVPVRMEQEGGASGKSLVGHYRRDVLDGYDFGGVSVSGNKEVRASPWASKAEGGDLWLLEAPWNNPWLDEVVAFPKVAHDDRVDATSGAFAYLSGQVQPVVQPQSMTAPSAWRA